MASDHNRYFIEDGQLGPILVPFTRWSREFVEVYRRESCVGIYANIGMGCELLDLAQLKELPHLRYLSILQRVPVTGWSALDLSCLRLLACDEAENLDLRLALRLELLSLGWRDSIVGMDSLAELRALSIHRAPPSLFKLLTNSKDIEELGVYESPLGTLNGIGTLRRLKALDLVQCRELRGLEGIEECSELEFVTINRCRRVETIAQLCNLARLRRLHVEGGGELDSIRCLEQCLGLERLVLSIGIRDGDVAFLGSHPALTSLIVDKRRNFNFDLSTLPSYRVRCHPRPSRWQVHSPELLAAFERQKGLRGRT